jgi:hypothetical protein
MLRNAEANRGPLCRKINRGATVFASGRRLFKIPRQVGHRDRETRRSRCALLWAMFAMTSYMLTRIRGTATRSNGNSSCPAAGNPRGRTSTATANVDVKYLFRRSWLPCTLLATVGVFLAVNLLADGPQSSSDDTRGIIPTEYAERIQTEISRKRLHSPTGKSKATVRYVALTNNYATVAEGADVGVTIWRLRPAVTADAKEIQEQTRIAVRAKGRSREKTLMMTPARAESETLFSDGDLLKFTVESPFEAYIYIINREQYEDGSLSDPYLIFPGRDDVGTNDKVFPGRLLFLPSAKDDDKFVLKRLNDLNPTAGKNPATIAETFTLILLKQPFAALAPLAQNEEPRKLTKQQLALWRADWGGRVWRFEMQQGAGASMTKAEKRAGTKGGGVLDGDDPTPQTVYHIERKTPNALIFDVSITIRK